MRRFFLISVFLLTIFSACTPAAEPTPAPSEQVAAVIEEATKTSQPTEIPSTATPLPTQTPTISPADMTPAEIAALPVEQQKEIIEARFEGGNVYETIVLSYEKLIFYDGKSWKELSALLGFNGEVLPWGEMYSFDNPEDIAKLKEIVGQEAEKVYAIEVLKNKYPEIKYIQFYPQNNTWTFQEDIDKPGYATFTLDGYIVLKNKNQVHVISVTTSPYRSLVLYQESLTGSFSTKQISEGNGLRESLIGITPRWLFTPDSTGNSHLYSSKIDIDFIQDWLGAEDLDNKEAFIDNLNNNKKPVFTSAIQTGTIGEKN